MWLKFIWKIVWSFHFPHNINVIILLLLLNWLLSIFHFLQKPVLCHWPYKSLLQTLVDMYNPLNVPNVAWLHCSNQGRCMWLLTPFDQLKQPLCYIWLFQFLQSLQVCQLLPIRWVYAYNLDFHTWYELETYTRDKNDIISQLVKVNTTSSQDIVCSLFSL